MDTKTLEDLLNEMLQKVLGSIIPALGPLVSGIASKGIRGLTGNDVMWDTVVASNQTPNGIYAMQQRRRIDRMADQVRDEYQTESRRQVFENYARTLTSSKDYTGSDYEGFIKKQVEAWQANGFKTGVYDRAAAFFSLDDTASSMANMRTLASNMAHHGLMLEDRNYMTGSSFVARNLFAGDKFDESKNNYELKRYDRKEWGNMGKEAVSALAASISKDTDMLNGYDFTKTEDLKGATEKFRKVVKNYAEALEPLKDVFGEDMTQMIQSLESMTGQSLTSMSPMQAKALSVQIADRTNAGMYGIGDVANMTGVMNASLSQMPGLGTYNYLSGTAQAMDVLDMTRNGGYSNSYRTKNQFNQFARSWVLSTANSGAADMFAKGYGLWRGRQQAAGVKDEEGLSFDAFKEQIQYKLWRDQKEAAGFSGDDLSIEAFRQDPNKEVSGDKRRAMMDMLKVKSVADLNAGMGNAGYADAIRTGAAGRMARVGGMRQQLDFGKFAMGADPAFLKAMGLSENAAGSKEAQSIYTNIIDLITENADFASYDEATLTEVLSKDPQKRYSPDAVRKIVAGMNYIKAKRPDLMDVASVEGNMTRAERVTASAKARRDKMKKLNSEYFSKNGIFQQIFEGGFSMEKIKEKLAAGKLIDEAGQDDDDLLAIMQAGGLAASKAFAGNSEEATGFAANVLNYANSAEGMSNSGFYKALGSFKEIQKKMVGMDHNSAEYKKLDTELQANASKMAMYSRLDSESVDKFWAGDIYKDGKKLEGDAAMAEKTRLANEWQKKSYSTDPKERRSMAASLEQHNIDQKLSQSSARAQELYKKFKEEYTRENGQVDNSKILEFYEKNKDKAGTKDSAALEELKKLVESNLGASDKKSPEDMMSLLKRVLQQLETYFGDQNKQNSPPGDENTKTDENVHNGYWVNPNNPRDVRKIT